MPVKLKILMLLGIALLFFFLLYCFFLASRYAIPLGQLPFFLRLRFLSLLHRLQSYRRRVVEWFDATELGLWLPRSQLVSSWTLSIGLLLVVNYYCLNSVHFLQLGLLVLLHLFIMRQLRFNVKQLEQVPLAKVQEVYYSCVPMMYMVFSFFLGFLLAWGLLLFPQSLIIEQILAINLSRLRIGSYVFALLMLAVIRSIMNLYEAPKKIIPGFYPEPRFIKKAMHVMIHQSFMYRHYILVNFIWWAGVGIHAFATYCRFFGYWSWWLSTPGPVIGILLSFCLLGVVVHSFIYWWAFTGHMEQRYEAKYKALDEAADVWAQKKDK